MTRLGRGRLVPLLLLELWDGRKCVVQHGSPGLPLGEDAVVAESEGFVSFRVLGFDPHVDSAGVVCAPIDILKP